MSNKNKPKMSVIICTLGSYEIIQGTIGYLRRQTVVGELELLMLTPRAEALEYVPKELEGFHSYRVIETDIENNISGSRAIAIHEAASPVVVFAEDHCFPEPRWAEALIEAHKGPWAAVGPTLLNANPGTVSWAMLFMTYGPWVAPVESGEVGDIPGHNSSYKREILLEYGDDLRNKLIRETMLHWDLVKRGYRLYIESKARAHHINVSRPSKTLDDLFSSGQMFVSAQALNNNWSRLTRLKIAILAPPGMLRYFIGVLKNIKRTGMWGEIMPQALPIIIIGLTASLLGSLYGYAFGFGNTHKKDVSMELDRFKHINDKDRVLLRKIREDSIINQSTQNENTSH